MKLASVSFVKNVVIPNLKSVSGVTAAPNLADRGGFSIEYVENMGHVRIEALKPQSSLLKDMPVCVPRENVASFQIVDDKNRPLEQKKS